MNNLTLLAFCWFAFDAQAQLQPPVPTPTKTGQVPKNDTGAAKQPPSSDKSSPKPKPVPVKEDKPKPDDGPHQDEADKRQDGSSQEWWSLLNTTAVTFFTLVLTIVTICQLWVMRLEMQATRDAAKAAIETVEQMRLDQRAWLVVRTPEVDSLDGQSRLKCNTVVQNRGRTPAFITMQVTVNFVAKDAGEFAGLIGRLPPIAASSEFKRATTIGPDGAFNFAGFLLSEPLGDEKSAAIKSGSMLLCIVDLIYYSDVFKSEHVTQAFYTWDHRFNEFRAHHDFNIMT